MPEKEHRVCKEREIQNLTSKTAEYAKPYSSLRAEKEVVER